MRLGIHTMLLFSFSSCAVVHAQTLVDDHTLQLSEQVTLHVGEDIVVNKPSAYDFAHVELVKKGLGLGNISKIANVGAAAGSTILGVGANTGSVGTVMTGAKVMQTASVANSVGWTQDAINALKASPQAKSIVGKTMRILKFKKEGNQKRGEHIYVIAAGEAKNDYKVDIVPALQSQEVLLANGTYAGTSTSAPPATTGASDAPATNGGKSFNANIAESVSAGSTFQPGTKLWFADDFSSDADGAMASKWKTNATGLVHTFPEQSGKWLVLNEFSSYKLKSNTSLPQNFTLEFDIATYANEAKDLTSVIFGFAHDNNISNYISGAYNDNAITSTEVDYWNKEIINSSSDTKLNSNTQFPLAQYAIAKMHVAVRVAGSSMQVYLDGNKVLDADVFSPKSTNKYFYFSTSTKISNSAKCAIGNFQVKEI